MVVHGATSSEVQVVDGDVTCDSEKCLCWQMEVIEMTFDFCLAPRALHGTFEVLSPLSRTRRCFPCSRRTSYNQQSLPVFAVFIPT